MKAITFVASSYLTRASVSLAIVSVFAAFVYAVLLLMTVMHAAARQSAQAHIGSLATQVGTLEAQYLQKTESITPSTAAQLGMVTPTVISTVASTDINPLSLRIGE